MFSIWTLIGITAIYLTLLFIIASWGDKAKVNSPFIYPLALGVHCTSWAYFGTATQAAEFGWALMPTYLGVILAMVFGHRLLIHIAQLCERHQISSLSELLSLRFRHSNSIALLVVAICAIGVIPYIALQLDAISAAIMLLTKNKTELANQISLTVAITMAFFAVWYGSRTLELRQKHTGLMLTLGFESIIKLGGFLTVGIFVVYWLYSGPVDLFTKAIETPETKAVLEQPSGVYIYISHVLLGICSMFILPRQFHINFVENRNTREIQIARWMFPLYLILFSVFVLPIAMAGIMQNPIASSASITSDLYVLSLPMQYNAEAITLISYIGGLAASTSMVIVATLALGNMINTSVIMPFWLATRKIHKSRVSLAPKQLLYIRQVSIAVLVGIAYLYHDNVGQTAPLVKSGTIAIALIAQLTPALFFSLFWNKTHKAAVLLGIISGVCLVVVDMLYPAIISSYYFASPPSDSDFADAIFASLALNSAIILLVSLVVPDKRPHALNASGIATTSLSITPARLKELLAPVIPADKLKQFEKSFLASNESEYISPMLVMRAERLLSAHLGNASAKILLTAVSHKTSDVSRDLAPLIEQATMSFQFNYEVLNSTIQLLPQGISVVDAELKLVAWNKAYETLFNFPADYLRAGMPVEDILTYNHQRGLLSKTSNTTDKDEEGRLAIQKRLEFMRAGTKYKRQRQQGQQRNIEIEGGPLPGGGYITTFTDVTEYIQIQANLEKTNAELEDRVQARTQELEKAKSEAEQANHSKTKFLAATGHDLMQPLNAANLFANMLFTKSQTDEQKQTTQHLISALDNAEQQLNMLLEMSKLDSGRIQPNLQKVHLGKVFQQLRNEFSVMAQKKGVELRIVDSKVEIETDKRLLTRVLQNLVANAIKYTHSGKVLLGTRRTKNGEINISVLDTGNGISNDQQQKIFQEFHRVNDDDSVPGLGLGLAIVKRMSDLMGYTLELRSQVNKGSEFTILTGQPYSVSVPAQLQTFEAPSQDRFLRNKQVLILENDAQVSQALVSLFEQWGSTVVALPEFSNEHAQSANYDIVMADYHLDNQQTGVQAWQMIQSAYDANDGSGNEDNVIAILSSADRSDEIREQATDSKMRYLPKPVKVVALKRMLTAHFKNVSTAQAN